jgi:hypothetical protein
MAKSGSAIFCPIRFLGTNLDLRLRCLHARPTTANPSVYIRSRRDSGDLFGLRAERIQGTASIYVIKIYIIDA